jgi:hypothetical protein
MKTNPMIQIVNTQKSKKGLRHSWISTVEETTCVLEPRTGPGSYVKDLSVSHTDTNGSKEKSKICIKKNNIHD